jgi:two-component system response regulator MtrA
MARRILIVEDEPAFSEVLAELLRDEGYAVLQVGDGVTALNMLGGGRSGPDLIVCDVMLPGLRGDRLAAEIRKRFPARRLPILLMSAGADPRVALRDVDFVPKPFETDDLLDRISTLLARPAAAAVVACP